MSWVGEMWRRVGMLVRGEKFARELEEEMRMHREMKEKELREGGASAEEARSAASRKFGNATVLRERSGEAWGWRWLVDFLQDARFGARMLRKNPGFTILAAITLAVGVGANTAVFSMVNAVILRALPYRDSGRMVSVHTKTAMFPLFSLGNSWPACERIREQTRALEQTAAYSQAEKTMVLGEEPVLLAVAEVGSGFFEELGIAPMKGRLLGDEDQKPGQEQVAVISDALWRERFAGAPDIVGQKLLLDRKSYTIVGVTAKRLAFPASTEVWVPMIVPAEIRQQQTYFALSVIGKLRRGETMERAQQQLNGIAEQLVKDAPELGGGYKLVASSLQEDQVGGSQRGYLILFGGATFVLLIGCANLASMLLARGLTRHREMAVRVALGASRGRLIRQGLAESCMLALLGCGAGIGVAYGGVQMFRAIAPANTQRLNAVGLDGSVLWFALGVSLLSGIALGLAPALRAAQTAPNEAIKQNPTGNPAAGRTGRFKFGGGLVVVEVALTFVLVIGSTLMTRTLANALRQSTGFRTDHLLTFDLPAPRQIQFNDDEAEEKARVERLKRILERVKGLPGVESVVATDHGVLRGMTMMHSGLQVEGAMPEVKGQERAATTRYVSPGFFQVMGIPILKGREFAERDVSGAPSGVVVNEAMARAYWGTLDVLGRRISLSKEEKTQKPIWNEVIGVAADTRDVRVVREAKPQYFLSALQGGVGSFHLLVRTRLEPGTLAKSVSHEIWAELPDQPVTHVKTMSQTIAESLGDQRLNAMLLDTFAGIGLILALAGVYGVVAFTVTRRTPEVGIRMAIGAQPADILRMMMREGLLPIGVGCVMGGAGGLGIGRVLGSQLYGVHGNDPLTFATTTVLVALVAGMACYLPARRSTRVDPVVALRYE